MATKKRKAPKKTANAGTAAAQVGAAPRTTMVTKDAAKFFASLAATTAAAVLKDREAFRQAYDIIDARLHPENQADRDAWEAFQNAAVLLERHHVAQERHRRLRAAAQL